MAPPSGSASRPGRALAALAAVIVVLFLVIVGSDLGSPGNWSKAFRVKLGLDLTSGTTVELKAIPEPGHPVTAQAMATARTIMFDRVNSLGFTGAQVVQQGNDIINVSAPGKKSGQLVNLVGQTARMFFRQVLLVAANTAPTTPVTTTPTPSPTGTASPTASPSAANPATPTPAPSASSSAGAAGLPGGSARPAREMAAGSSLLRLTAAHPKPSRSPSASSSPSATPTPTPSSSAVPKAANGTTSWQQAQALGGGNAALVTPEVRALFNKLDCAKGNWKTLVGYTHDQFDQPGRQIVSCGKINGIWYKYALDKSTVYGSMIKAGSAQAQLQPTSTFWMVVLNFDGPGTSRWAALTTRLFNTYGTRSVLDQVAVVLDGTVQSAETVEGAITGGNTQITGQFNQQQATQLANVLAYGSLPLSFKQESVQTVSPQLGHDQLDAGLIAGGVGLLLVLCYLIVYYRGLAVIAASSLVIAAALTYESVIVLGKLQNFRLSLAGVAGLIVAVGITADSFVVFFERLRDEVREGGRSLRTAVEHGWTRARRTILVSDTVSFLAAALLYYFAIGDVRGFAFTLGLTTLIDVLVVFTFTKPMMTLLARTRFYGGGHPLSGLDPARLGARAPWRGTPRPVRPATARAAARASSRPSQAKEA